MIPNSSAANWNMEKLKPTIRSNRRIAFVFGGNPSCSCQSRLLLGALLFAFSLPCWADPVLPHLIGDHMVLQQQREIHVWGKADPEEQISVTLSGRTSSAGADANGRWSVELPPMRAGGPFMMS